MLCPCCSQKPYHDCCGPYLSGERRAPSPEALMRSRYTAYSKANIDYIVQTMVGPAAEGYDPVSSREWAESVHWTGLEVLSSSEEGDEGAVIFKAYYSHQNQMHILAEHSLFKRIDGEWKYYVGGSIE